MSDEADHASELQQLATDLAIKRILANKQTSCDKKITIRDCDECGNRIPLARVEAVNATLCVDCQRAYELEDTRYRRFN